jgi:hypothetical protein
MKWILFVYLVSSTSTGSITSDITTLEFNTYNDCRAAREVIYERIPKDGSLSFATCLAKE